MKNSIKFLFIASIIGFFNSCSNDSDSEVDNSKLMYENIASVVYDSTTKAAVFRNTDPNGIYILTADNVDFSHRFVEKVIGQNWDGKTMTINLGEYGQVKLLGHTDDMLPEGVFNELIINIADFEPLSLRILDKARVNEDNGYDGGGVAVDDVSLYL